MRRWFLPAEAVSAALFGSTAALVMQSPLLFALPLVVVAMVTNYHMGLETIRPGLPHLGRIVRDAALPMLLVTIGVAAHVLQPARLTEALVIVAVVAGTALLGTVVRRAVEGQLRLVVVGNPESAALAAARWAGDRRAKVVGAVLVDGGRRDALSLSDSFGVDVVLGSDDVAHWVTRWESDVVAMVGAPDAESVRRLSWALEGTSASLAVMGVVDRVAPHRIDASTLAGGTLLHIRSSRPSLFVRSIKAAADRVLGGLLLVVAAPLLAVLTVLVRLDSSGKAWFTQTRVGQDGKPFTIFKLRTMHTDAERRLAELQRLDEGNGVLFKIRNDPRITRVGRLLRKTSLDELPQLVNVVRGEMSLVGPRPALPQEVEQYSDLERRRLAVRPGMTGLWQVSGRSNLSWEESVELDLRYADNWRLVDDLGIGVRTVDAVVRSRGAY
ncbi:exopolysaccharide biosynthesis polyprenyl glycosylphosphotransferase [Nocardioides sp.]|uniref:exopolysaccharide biosynthesis polyprenyl glycosylphosphotransferase n=1 Tax=Nocardioides sp. TaxID=35761 RepID=UPI003528F26C